MKTIAHYFKRTIVELALFISIFVILFVAPVEWQRPGAQLLLYKSLLLSASQIQALAIRKMFFNYIHFSTESDLVRKLMVVGIHLGSIYIYATGGERVQR